KPGPALSHSAAHHHTGHLLLVDWQVDGSSPLGCDGLNLLRRFAGATAVSEPDATRSTNWPIHPEPRAGHEGTCARPQDGVAELQIDGGNGEKPCSEVEDRLNAHPGLEEKPGCGAGEVGLHLEDVDQRLDRKSEIRGPANGDGKAQGHRP